MLSKSVILCTLVCLWAASEANGFSPLNRFQEPVEANPEPETNSELDAENEEPSEPLDIHQVASRVRDVGIEEIEKISNQTSPKIA